MPKTRSISQNSITSILNKFKGKWKILSFVNNGKAGGIKGFIVPLQSDGEYCAPGFYKLPNQDYSLEGSLKKEYLDIHSIKRLEDGHIFTVGQEITLGGSVKKTINSINFGSSGMISGICFRGTNLMGDLCFKYQTGFGFTSSIIDNGIEVCDE